MALPHRYLCGVVITTTPLTNMNSTIVLSNRVINTIKSLPEGDSTVIARALADEMLFGAPTIELTPVQQIALAMIRHNVIRDTRRAQ